MMTSSRPYLIRALYDWIIDNRLTPHLLVDAAREGVVVPRQYVENGKIILNISPDAVASLSLGNTSIEFKARFGGVPVAVHIPVSSVMAIYARENGQGMMFGGEDDGGSGGKNEKGESPGSPPASGARSHLKVIK